eukprot:TRINITY_DN83209_c0_g1_i1.p1 TRINITY_DN83209_c0_g1~~TRINITY_DN83209_c0_g1_i1.p1  ORF type:complete len:181 (+),score=7.27 TRINITY_DN83209_c0_g1_i1:98-640(+)
MASVTGPLLHSRSAAVLDCGSQRRRQGFKGAIPDDRVCQLVRKWKSDQSQKLARGEMLGDVNRPQSASAAIHDVPAPHRVFERRLGASGVLTPGSHYRMGASGWTTGLIEPGSHSYRVLPEHHKMSQLYSQERITYKAPAERVKTPLLQSWERKTWKDTQWQPPEYPFHSDTGVLFNQTV